MFGISVSNLTSSQREQLEFTESGGVLVTKVDPASFADDIGILQNDVILAINRKPVTSVNDIRDIQGGLKPGGDVAFKVMRRSPIPGASQAWNTLYLAGVLPESGGQRF
jgi:S1-C subfamily serine protease